MQLISYSIYKLSLIDYYTLYVEKNQPLKSKSCHKASIEKTSNKKPSAT